jgi:hypothetical protein
MMQIIASTVVVTALSLKEAVSLRTLRRAIIAPYKIISLKVSSSEIQQLLKMVSVDMPVFTVELKKY